MVNAVKVFTLRLCISAYYIHFKRVKVKIFTAFTIIRSMSKKGCSPDNAACEGFHGRLKNEFFYNRSWRNISIDSFIELLDEYIRWYCEKRIKVSLGGMSIN